MKDKDTLLGPAATESLVPLLVMERQEPQAMYPKLNGVCLDIFPGLIGDVLTESGVFGAPG